jgi:hypothetical protein
MMRLKNSLTSAELANVCKRLGASRPRLKAGGGTFQTAGQAASLGILVAAPETMQKPDWKRGKR